MDIEKYYKLINEFKQTDIIQDLANRKISHGSFGQVILGITEDAIVKNKPENKAIDFICNIFPEKCYIKKEQDIRNIKIIQNEVNILKLLNNKNTLSEILFENGYNNICKMYSNIDNVIYMEYYPITLYTICNKKYSFTLNFYLTIFKQIIQGMCYIHSLNITHNDLKTENITINTENKMLIVKIIDFGCARLIKNNNPYIFLNGKIEINKTRCFSLNNVDPLLSHEEKYNLKNDVWSLALIFIEMICGVKPIITIFGMEFFKEKVKKKIIKIPEITESDNIDEIFESKYFDIFENNYDKIFELTLRDITNDYAIICYTKLISNLKHLNIDMQKIFYDSIKILLEKNIPIDYYYRFNIIDMITRMLSLNIDSRPTFFDCYRLIEGIIS